MLEGVSVWPERSSEMSVKIVVSAWKTILPGVTQGKSFYVLTLGIPKGIYLSIIFNNRARKRFTIFSQALRAFETRRCLPLQGGRP
jgi:hypothetical protein